jgi:adenine-specific DNA-methyltransferase
MAIAKLQPSYKFNEEQLKQLRQIAPEAFMDNILDFNALYEALSDTIVDDIEVDDETYGLLWPGKTKAKRIAHIPPFGTIVPNAENSFNSSSSSNILIEGDNLECLKLLKKSYGGAITLIYIDPPYNTGTDLIYDDDFSESHQEHLQRTGKIDEAGKLLTTNSKSDGRFHSKWLSMIYPRIKLGYELLKDDGFMLIHIDENEIENLTLVMNEIFGEENNVGMLIWDKRNPKGDSRGIAYQHEYILCYIKNKEYLTTKDTIQRPKRNAPIILEKAQELYSKLGKKDLPNEVKDLIKKYKLEVNDIDALNREYDLELINKEFAEWIAKQDFSGGEKAYNKIDSDGNVFQTVSMAWPNKKQAPDEYFIPLKHPITGKDCPIPDRGWRFPPKTMQELLEKKLIVFGQDESTQPRSKYLLKENLYENIPSIIPFGGSDDKLFAKWKIPFENPKPYKFSAELLKYFVNENDIVLDFFAGSGTTGHAVFELSAQISGLRFILIQFPEKVKEKTLAYKAGFRRIVDITRKRLTLASELYDSKLSLGFSYYSYTTSSMKKWQNYKGKDAKELVTLFSQHESSLVDDWKPENLLTEILLIEGFPLDSKIETVEGFKKNKVQKVTSDFCEHSLFVCLDKKVEDDTIKALSLGDNDIFICLDNAVTDQDKARLDDKGLIKTI